jgi:PAS domain S-box-containing protein
MAWPKPYHLKALFKARWPSSQGLAIQALAAAVYFFGGKLGLFLAHDNFIAAPIWPPAGLALAAILIFGYRLWPGLLVGAFLLDLTMPVETKQQPIALAAAALCRSSSEILQALVATWLAETYACGRDTFRQPRSVALFFALTAIASPAIGATSNSIVSLLAGLIHWRDLDDLWTSLWLANMLAVVLLTPLLLAWSSRPFPKISFRRAAEASALFLLLLVALEIGFGPYDVGRFRGVAFSCMLIPTLLWTAFRFGERGTVTANFVFGSLALLGTLRGHGPFVIVGDSRTSFLLAQNFIAALTLMALLLAAEVKQRQRIDEGLRASEQRYRDLFEYNPQPMWVFDYDSLRFLAVNQAAVQHYGYSREEFLGMAITDIRPPEDVPVLLQVLKQARLGLQVPRQYRHRKKDGTIIDVDINRYNLVVDGREAAMVLATDVTERKRTEERTAAFSAALRESEQRLRLALAASRMGIWTMELQGQRRFISSPELDAIFGLKPGEFDGTEKALFDLIHPEDHRLVRTAMVNSIRTQGEYELEFRILPRDRDVGWLLARGCSCFDARGEPCRLVGVAFDITARKAAEDSVFHLNLDLERRVAERTAELEAINKELESFSYSVSHDLRAPLRSIRGFSEVLLDRYAGKLDARGREFLRRTAESSHQMDLLIDDLLKLSRIGRVELRQQPVDLSALAESIAVELRAAEPKRSVKFAIAPGLHACGDERLLRIALENLLRNAWKFTANQPKPRIEFGETAGPQSAYFVRDNGAGFDMAYASRLFGVFQRLHSAAEFPGTGIGLATVQRILNRHGGSTWAESAVNQGATFYFTLPRNGGSEFSPANCQNSAADAIVPQQISA